MKASFSRPNTTQPEENEQKKVQGETILTGNYTDVEDDLDQGQGEPRPVLITEVDYDTDEEGNQQKKQTAADGQEKIQVCQEHCRDKR